jgi:UDP-glucose 4-epimerase
MKVLITGGAGYIGSVTIKLKEYVPASVRILAEI